MGWMRTIFLGDIGNHLDISDTRRDLDGVRRALRATAHDQRAIDAAQTEHIASLERRIEDLQLTVAALSRLLVSRGVLAQPDLEGLVDRLDP